MTTSHRESVTTRPISRRRLLQTGLASAVGLALPGSRLAFGQQASETLNLASVGVGGKGWSDLMASAKGKNVRVIGLCDVDQNHLSRAAGQFGKAQTFSDYRVMLDKLGKDIDALLVSTPDHMHGPIAIAAMQLGIHVHVQKPLTHNIAELRAMMRLAEDNPQLVTQMGTQIHSHAAYRTGVAMCRAGAIGKVSEAHLWVSKSWAGPAGGRPDREDPVPESLDWENWQGVAPRRPYVNKAYHPGNWRGWMAYGSGTLGDMGCHIFDPVFSCLDLGMPTHVVSRGPQHHFETFAGDSEIHYAFAGTDFTADKLLFRWTDGSRSSRPDASRAQLPEGVGLPGAGMFLVGEKGVMVLPHFAMPRFYSAGEDMEIKPEFQSNIDHYTEFTDACRGVGKTSTPFSYSARVTEAVLVGTIAGRFKDKPLAWDSENMRFDHSPATDLVHRDYAPGLEPAGMRELLTQG